MTLFGMNFLDRIFVAGKILGGADICLRFVGPAEGGFMISPQGTARSGRPQEACGGVGYSDKRRALPYALTRNSP